MTENLFTQVPDSGERPWVLAIDFGTTATSAVIADENGIEILEVDGARTIPSAVLVDENGELVAGKPAADQGLLHPDRVERTPKRAIGDEHVVLGGTPVRVVDCVAAVLSLVLGEASRRRGGSAPSQVCLTHPASWEQHRQDALLEAAKIAGLPRPRLMAEPVAAAVHLAGDNPVPAGAMVAVYDLGGGTFDAAVLRRTENEFELAGAPGGVDHLGGEDFDRALYAHLVETVAGEDLDASESLLNSEERQWRRASADLLGKARLAKEALSRQGSYTVYALAPVDRELRVTREELDGLIRDDIVTTVTELEATAARAHVPLQKLAAVYLVGGSSRLPIVASVVGERLGRVPDVRDDPKAVVALGAAEAIAATLKPAPLANPAAATDPIRTPNTPPKKQARRRMTQAASTLVVLGLIGGGALKATASPGGNSKPKPTPTPSAVGSSTTTTAPHLTDAQLEQIKQAQAAEAARQAQAQQDAAQAAQAHQTQVQGIPQQRGGQLIQGGSPGGTVAQQPRSTGGTTALPGAGATNNPSGPAINSIYQVSEQSAGFAWFGPGGPTYWSEYSTGYGGHNYSTGAVPSWGNDCADGTQDNSGRWTAALPVAGHYRLDVYVPHDGASTTNARYEAFASDGKHEVDVNQYMIDSQWVTLGTWPMSSGKLELTDLTGEACNTKHVAFDDVRCVYVGA